MVQFLHCVLAPVLYDIYVVRPSCVVFLFCSFPPLLRTSVLSFLQSYGHWTRSYFSTFSLFTKRDVLMKDVRKKVPVSDSPNLFCLHVVYHPPPCGRPHLALDMLYGRACFKKNSSLHIWQKNFSTTFFRILPQKCNILSLKNSDDLFLF